jgi:ABC-type polysaccharide/polyol phosphate export permease
MRVPGVPFWVTIFALILACGGAIVGILAYAHSPLATWNPSWGGRTLGLALGMALAIWLRAPAGYAVAFLGALFRDIGDLWRIIETPLPDLGLMGWLVILILLEAFAFVASFKAARRRDH